MKYQYPLIASWSKSTYAVVENGNDASRLDFIRLDEPGEVYRNDRTKAAFESLIGSCVTIHTPVENPPAEPLALKVEVDASPLTKALADAKELEATLLRIKALLA